MIIILNIPYTIQLQLQRTMHASDIQSIAKIGFAANPNIENSLPFGMELYAREKRFR